MATLKEAVESGRRWRHKEWASAGTWLGPGNDNRAIMVDQALSSDFEIERDEANEPLRTGQRFECGHPDWCSCGKKPEPEKPREIVLYETRDSALHLLSCRDILGVGLALPRTYHDADACDRLFHEPPSITVLAEDFERWISSFRTFQESGVGAFLEIPLVGPSATLRIRRSWEHQNARE